MRNDKLEMRNEIRGKNKMMREKKENKRGLAGKHRGYTFPTTNKKTLLCHFLSYISLPLQSFSVFLQAIN